MYKNLISLKEEQISANGVKNNLGFLSK